MKAYLDLLRHVMDYGQDRQDRTGVGTRAVFGYQFRHNLQDGFPLLTTKKVHVKSVIHELLWFLRGETNVRSLQSAGVTIWDEWADEEGDLGPVYGAQWRRWPDYRKAMAPAPAGLPASPYSFASVSVGTIDQIANLVRDLRENPFSRRHIVTAWNPADLPAMALPPCHTLFQCQVSSVPAQWTRAARKGMLNLHLYARSIDSFLGLPFNIASYAFLLRMLAEVTDLYPGELIISFGDLHIYRNHFDQVAEQLAREPRPLPELVIVPWKVQNIDDFRFEDFVIEGYNPHPAIKAPIAV